MNVDKLDKIYNFLSYAFGVIMWALVGYFSRNLILALLFGPIAALFLRIILIACDLFAYDLSENKKKTNKVELKKLNVL